MAYTQPVAIQDIRLYDSELSLPVGMTAYRDLMIAQRYTMWGDSIADGISGEWITTSANGGTLTSTGGEGLLQTSASATGSMQITGPVVPYLPGQVAWFNSSIRVGDTGSVGNIRRWGNFTISAGVPQDGFYFELNGITFNIVISKGGVATPIASGSWSNAATSPFTIDSNYHGFEIRYTTNTARFFVDNILRHVVAGTTTTITNTLSFPISTQNINSSGATNRILAIRNIGQGRFGTPPQTINGVQKNTYVIPINRLQLAALVANTTRQVLSIEHSATSIKTVRIKKIHIGVLNTTAVAGDLRVLIDYGTAASSGGTVVTAQPVNSAISTAEVVAKTVPTITAATTKFSAYVGAVPATANASIVGITVYEWQAGSDEQQFVLRAGVLESLVIGIQSFGLNIYHLTGYVTLTEE